MIDPTVKPLEKRIEEKEKLISQISAQLDMTEKLFATMTGHYEEVYDENKGKGVDSKQIAGFASLLNSMNSLYTQKTGIQNEINAMIDQSNQEEEIDDSLQETTANKTELLHLIRDQSKEA